MYLFFSLMEHFGTIHKYIHIVYPCLTIPYFKRKFQFKTWMCPCCVSLAASSPRCFLLSWLYGPRIESTAVRVKTPNVKHPLWNLDMVTRKCLAPNSSIYWIVANIPGRRTLTKPRLELTSAPNQHRKKLLCSFTVPFVHKVRHEETECLFEVILCSELLDGNISACRLRSGE